MNHLISSLLPPTVGDIARHFQIQAQPCTKSFQSCCKTLVQLCKCLTVLCIQTKGRNCMLDGYTELGLCVFKT